jgi:hypothetical protein
MIRAHGRPACSLVTLGRRRAPSQAAVREQPVALGLSSDRLAVEVVRHLNDGDLTAFRRVVAPSVRLTAAPGGGTTLDAGELFGRLSSLVPGQTLCASRIRATETGARIDLEVAWPVPSGECASSLGTLDLAVAGGRVTGLTLDLDVDPAVERAAAALAAAGGRLRRGAAR